MDEDNLNMQIRKFLKKVGITSQREIEKVVYSGLENKTININNDINLQMTLLINVNELKSEHKIVEKIKIS